MGFEPTRFLALNQAAVPIRIIYTPETLVGWEGLEPSVDFRRRIMSPVPATNTASSPNNGTGGEIRTHIPRVLSPLPLPIRPHPHFFLDDIHSQDTRRDVKVFSEFVETGRFTFARTSRVFRALRCFALQSSFGGLLDFASSHCTTSFRRHERHMSTHRHHRVACM